MKTILILICLGVLWVCNETIFAADETADPAAPSAKPTASENAAPVTDTEKAQPLTVAIFDFEAREREIAEQGALVAELAGVRLAMKDSVRLVSRQEIAKLLEEQKLKLAGLTEEAAPRVGQLLGAQVVVTGRVFPLRDRLIVTTKVIGVETGRVYAEKAQGEAGQIESLGAEISDKIGDLVAKGRDTLVAKVRLTSDQIESLKKRLGKERLPVVFVYMPETVLGRVVPDPAAQTELIFILKKIGCDVAKDRSGSLKRWAEGYHADRAASSPPDVQGVDLVLIGEAFGEFAARTGDLVSSRARIELEALDPRTGKVVAIDRETFVATDLAEQIAAKSALQETASRLAFRLLPEAVEAWRGVK